MNQVSAVHIKRLNPFWKKQELKKYPGRFKLLHIKDECELGQSGMVGYDAIFKNVKEAGTKHIVVEVERYSMPVLESIKESIDYLLQSDFVPASYE